MKEGSGLLAITRPWPSMLRTVWGDDARYVSTYFSRWDVKTYFPGDGAKRDAAGNFMILGRVDDVLNVSAHRIGTMEVESALVDHPSVAEAAVVGRSHDLKGQAIVAFVSLKNGQTPNSTMVEDLKQHVVKKIGALAGRRRSSSRGIFPRRGRERSCAACSATSPRVGRWAT